MDFVLDNRAFSAIESYPHLIKAIQDKGLVDEYRNKKDPDLKIHGIQIQAAILGSEAGHPFFKDCLDYYDSIHFDAENGVPSEDKISPIVFAGVAERYGFKYLDKEQYLNEGFKLYSSDIFCPQPYLMKKEAIAVHCCNASWRSTLSLRERVFSNFKVYVKRFLIKVGLRREDAIERLR